MRRMMLVALLAAALAGCMGGGGPPATSGPTGPTVEGWVVDERIAPVEGAIASLAGLGLEARTDADGHYVLQAPPGVDLVLVMEAPQFVAQSRAVAALSGAHHVLNFTLVRMPVQDPFDEVQSFQGILRCGLVATTQEDPSRPHEHQGVRCSQALNDTANRWAYTIPAGSTGIVVEAQWDAQSEVSQALVLKVVTEATGEVLGFIEGTSMLRMQLSSVKLAQETQAGHEVLWVTAEPGAGTGNHEHGAIGVFVSQSFTLYATAFFNGPVPPSYSIADR